MTSSNLILCFVGGETLLYLLYKIARNDFFYWPTAKGKGSVVLAIVARSLVKIIVDFSGCLHFRHPYEMGGLAYVASEKKKKKKRASCSNTRRGNHAVYFNCTLCDWKM